MYLDASAWGLFIAVSWDKACLFYVEWVLRSGDAMAKLGGEDKPLRTSWQKRDLQEYAAKLNCGYIRNL